MDRLQLFERINARYSALASATHSLSCGPAVRFAPLVAGQICVDLGCGRGLDVVHMASMVGPQGAAYGVDTADGMLERAEREALRRGLHNAHFLKCPLDALTLPSAFADIIISTDALSHAQSKREVLTELHRVLKPGGRFVISDVYSLEPVPEHFREDTDAMAEGWAGAILRHEYIATLQELGFDALCVFEESEPYDMGPIEVVGFTVAGQRPLG